jgi:Beta-propeller repeat
LGAKQWTRLLGSPGDDGAYGVAADSSGNIYVAGSTDSYGGLDGNANAGGPDAFLAKYDSTGVKQWTRLLGSSGNDWANGVALDDSGNIYITGFTGGNLGGNANAGAIDVFLAKCDFSGAMQWIELLGSSGNDWANGIAVDGSGNIYITGYTDSNLDGNANGGNYDTFLAKFDSTWGIKQWTRLLGSLESDIAYGVAVDGDGYVYITGYTDSNLDGNGNAGGADAFMAKYDSSGVKQWTRLTGSLESDIAYGVAVDNSSNIYVAGITDGNIDGNINAGDYDIFWTRYSPDGAKQ